MKEFRRLNLGCDTLNEGSSFSCVFVASGVLRQSTRELSQTIFRRWTFGFWRMAICGGDQRQKLLPPFTAMIVLPDRICNLSILCRWASSQNTHTFLFKAHDSASTAVDFQPETVA